MYLYARKYVSKNDYTNFDREKAEKPPINEEWKTLATLSPKGLMDNSQDFGEISISFPVGYWRKANAVHGWFVNNLAGGLDECQEIHVPRNALVDLLAACKAVMSVSVAESKQDVADEFGLNPTEGFFFGGYELNEFYDEDIKYTIKMIECVLENTSPQKIEFVYQASW